nr:hypothetical protein Iba_chr09aCG7830 [Ipomoea batatas]
MLKWLFCAKLMLKSSHPWDLFGEIVRSVVLCERNSTHPSVLSIPKDDGLIKLEVLILTRGSEGETGKETAEALLKEKILQWKRDDFILRNAHQIASVK